MTTKTGHTPTPWIVHARNTGMFYSDIEIFDKNENALTDDSHVHIENAKFIERAVNSHEALLKAVTLAKKAIEKYQDEQRELKNPYDRFSYLSDVVSAAIKQAEGK